MTTAVNPAAVMGDTRLVNANAAPMPCGQARLLSAQTLAYVGDSVHDLYTRARLIRSGKPVGLLHEAVVGRVRCAAQANGLSRLEPLLTQDELAVARRGRNSRARHPKPRGATSADYARATGLESLLGYLYLTGQEARLTALLDALETD